PSATPETHARETSQSFARYTLAAQSFARCARTILCSEIVSAECSGRPFAFCANSLGRSNLFADTRLPPNNHALAVHVGADGGGNVDRAIHALIVLHHGDERAADGKPGTIQRMHEFGLPLRVAKARLHPSRL